MKQAEIRRRRRALREERAALPSNYWGLPTCSGCPAPHCEGCAGSAFLAEQRAEIDEQIRALDTPRKPAALTGELFALVGGEWVAA